MKEAEIERRLAQALEKTAPDDAQGVLSRCEAQKGTVISMTTKANSRRPLRGLLAACLALVLLGGGGLLCQRAYAVASVVSLDVNPSMELRVSRSETVLSCTPLNAEARDILADMNDGADLKGVKLTVAVNAVVGSLVRHGYLDSASSAILISVEDKDERRAARLQQELTDAVDSLLQDAASAAAVLGQTLPQDKALEAEARENNVSTGKAALIRRVLDCNDTLHFDRLAALSVEELKQLLEAGAPDMPIGKAAAGEAAGKYAGAHGNASVTAEVDAELDEAPACYEVELYHPALGEFEYVVDAYTGKVLSGRKDAFAQLDDDAKPINTDDIGLAAAKKAALRHAGVSANDAVFTKTERDLDDGRLEYELDFYTDDAEYEYTIDGATGAVLDWEREAFRTAAADTDDRRGEDGHDANDPDDPDDDEDNDRDDRDEHDEDDD